MRFDPAIAVADDPQVYRPSEDSLLLLEAIELRRDERFLEVGTGAGLIALHAARVGTTVATDANRAAVLLARRNALKNGLPVRVVQTNLAAGVRGPFDVVAFNPPYLEGRPRDELDRAWAGGSEGSEISLRFLHDVPRLLGPQGRAYLLLSRVNRAAREVAERGFRVKLVATRRLFFEDLDVLELRRPGP